MKGKPLYLVQNAIMRKLFPLLLILLVACKNEHKNTSEEADTPKLSKKYTQVNIEPILENDSLSIRAIEIIGKNVVFAANNGSYGLFNSANKVWKISTQEFDTITPEFRSLASTANDFFMLSVGSPALLYKTGDDGKMKLVYQEDHEKAFYDAVAFWNENEGIAIGDPTDKCLSMIVTRDGGQNWEKLDCSMLPKAEEGEAAFAASNSNIAIQGDEAWVLSGGVKSRIYHSTDKGHTWEVFDTPLLQGEPTQGGYSMDFYDAENGIIIGGDYTKPEGNSGNKAITSDGGKTWKLIADGNNPGYKSSVRYFPNGDAKHIVAVGFTGIDYTSDGGETWKNLSEEGFYTIRFLNDSTAYAAGKGRIARLDFQ